MHHAYKRKYSGTHELHGFPSGTFLSSIVNWIIHVLFKITPAQITAAQIIGNANSTNVKNSLRYFMMKLSQIRMTSFLLQSLRFACSPPPPPSSVLPLLFRISLCLNPVRVMSEESSSMSCCVMVNFPAKSGMVVAVDVDAVEFLGSKSGRFTAFSFTAITGMGKLDDVGIFHVLERNVSRFSSLRFFFDPESIS